MTQEWQPIEIVHLFRTQWGMWKQPANDNHRLSEAEKMLLEILEFNK